MTEIHLGIKPPGDTTRDLADPADVADLVRRAPTHFHRWLELFHETVDADWAGPNAEHIKKIARNVAEVHSGQLLGEAVETSNYR